MLTPVLQSLIKRRNDAIDTAEWFRSKSGLPPTVREAAINSWGIEAAKWDNALREAIRRYTQKLSCPV